MSIEDFSIIYNYFEPSQQERQTVHSIISNIYYSGPSDAVVKAMITRHHGRYLCQLRVASSAMIEVVNFESDKLLRAVIGARRIMNLKIQDWKSRRFENIAI
ncbi:MAG: hypothetical protein KDD33_11120 [Bdellovibrionales bacterium]|nr:hypothetical protein [Bdellovibrionales bacterium]